MNNISHKRQNLRWKASNDWLQNARLTPAVSFCLFVFFFFFDFALQNILRQFWKPTEARLTTFEIRSSTKCIQPSRMEAAQRVATSRK